MVALENCQRKSSAINRVLTMKRKKYSAGYEDAQVGSLGKCMHRMRIGIETVCIEGDCLVSNGLVLYSEKRILRPQGDFVVSTSGSRQPALGSGIHEAARSGSQQARATCWHSARHGRYRFQICNRKRKTENRRACRRARVTDFWRVARKYRDVGAHAQMQRKQTSHSRLSSRPSGGQGPLLTRQLK